MKAVSIIAVLAFASGARAGTYRVAVIVGNNEGASDRPALRYAEADAQKMAGTLGELGGIAAPDLHLLTGRSLGDVRRELTVAAQRVAAWRLAEPSAHVVMVFFFSGHSDGEALELGSDRLGFAELRRWLSQVGADVRLAIVDSCKSGALLAAKGGRPGPAFTIRLSDDIASTGEALLTSSAADELALESREIHGSFFTHYLVSGLRGAADASGDGRVTLAEAYEYAFARTVSATANTTIGPQHPAYDYRLSGQGDLVLSEFSHPTAALDLPRSYDRILVHDDGHDTILAEAPSGAATRLALPVGRYTIYAWRGGKTYAAHISLRSGDTRTLAASDLVPSPPMWVASKGDDPRRLGISVVAGLGVDAGIASGVPVHGSMHLGVRSSRPTGWSAGVWIGTARGDGFWETTAFALGGYHVGFLRGRIGGFIGAEAGVGLVSQNLDHGTPLQTPSVAGVPQAGVSVRLSPSTALLFEADCLLGWVRKANANALLVLPTGWLGVAQNF